MSCLLPPVCAFCKHILNAPEQECRAFQKIPDAIMLGHNDHLEPLEGDGGYQFCLAEEHREAFSEVNDIRQSLGLAAFRLMATDSGKFA